MMVNKSTFTRLVMCLCLGLLLIGCGRGASPEDQTAVSPQDATSSALAAAILASSQPPLNFETLLQETNDAEALWQSQEIDTYRLQVSHSEPSWNNQIFTLLVENGTITEEDHSCFPDRTCVLQAVDVNTLAIANLFETARQVIALEDHDTEITFNDRLGYPNAIIYSGGSWIVQSIEPLE